MKKSNMKHLLWSMSIIMPVLVCLSGCVGLTTKSERQARSDFETLSKLYHPDGHQAALPALDSNSTLATLLTYAMLNQPRVEAAYYEYAASVEKITLERSLSDPRFTFQMDITNVINSVMPGLMIDVPWPTKLSTKADVASAESQARYYAFESAVLQTAFNVKNPYYQLHFLGERVRINRKMLVLMDGLEEIARALDEAGKVTLQDVLRAQIEQERLKNEIANLEDSRNPLMSKLKTALGMSAEQADPPVPAHFDSTSPDVSSEQLLATALAHNPQLKSMEAEVRAAEEGINLARLSRFPDFTVGVEGDVKASPIMVRPKLEMTLPVWLDKIAAEIAASQARKLAASSRLSSEQILLAVGFADASYRYREARRNLQLLDGNLVSKAQMSLDVARESYSTGRIDFINLLEAERTLLKFQLAEVEARIQCELTLAELSLIIGMKPEGAPATGVNNEKTPAKE
jgi:cobalt-zinc-cadmium efflux system outer membrane protein